MKPAHVLMFFLFVIVASKPSFLSAQVRPCNTVSGDTLFICAGSHIEIDGKRVRFIDDTFRILPKNVHWRILDNPLTASTRFYDSLRKVAYSSRLGKVVYNLLIPGEKNAIQSFQDEMLTKEGSEKYKRYSGREVRKIYIRQVALFGDDIYGNFSEKISGIERFGNSLHSNTRKSVINRSLIFKEGDTVNPLVFSDNEQILRDLGYFEDVRVEIIPWEADTNFVDVLLRLKDFFSIGIDIGVRNISHWNLGVFDRNFLGRGHRIGTSISANASSQPFLSMAAASYLIPNILGTFFDASLGWVNEASYSSITAGLNRDFYTYNLRYAGGINFSHHEELKNLYLPYLFTDKIIYNSQQFWLGRSWLLIPGGKPVSVALSGGINNRLYTRRPFASPDSNRVFYNSSQVLMSLSIYRNLFYTSNYVYQFGRTEDIPYGYIFEVTAGPDGYEFYDRFYTGMSLGWGQYYSNFGYVSARFSVSGYRQKEKFEQGLIAYKAQYFSNLVRSGFFKLRFFASAAYMNGLSRLDGESINVVEELGLSGLDSDDTLYFSGSKKLSLNVNTNIFTPFYFYGFKVAFFNFANMVWVGASNVPAYNNKFYSGFGFGVNLRNEKLVIKTLQFKIAFYPGLPEKRGAIQFEFSGINLLQFFTFRPRAPKPLLYQ